MGFKVDPSGVITENTHYTPSTRRMVWKEIRIIVWIAVAAFVVALAIAQTAVDKNASSFAAQPPAAAAVTPAMFYRCQETAPKVNRHKDFITNIVVISSNEADFEVRCEYAKSKPITTGVLANLIK